MGSLNTAPSRNTYHLLSLPLPISQTRTFTSLSVCLLNFFVSRANMVLGGDEAAGGAVGGHSTSAERAGMMYYLLFSRMYRTIMGAEY